MPIIDTYTIFGSWPAGGADLSIDRLTAALGGKDIVAAIAHSTDSIFQTTVESNAESAARIAAVKGLFPAAVVDPTMSLKPWETAATIAASQCACIRFFPDIHKWPVANYIPFEKCLEAIAPSQVPISLAITTPGQISALSRIDTARQMKVILSHVAEDCVSEVAAVLSGVPGWYLSTDGLVRTGLLEEMVNAVGSERLIFGSTAPRGSVAGALNYVKHSSLSDSVKESILFSNASALFGGRIAAN